MMNNEIKLLKIVLILSLSFLFVGQKIYAQYPYCNKTIGRCVLGCSGPLCYTGCGAACELDCYVSGSCAHNRVMCSGGSREYYYDNCCYGSGSCTYGSSCSQDCDCTDTCCVPRGCSCGSYATSSKGYGSITITCSDGCGGTASTTCYCTSACTPKACPTGTSESGQHGTYATYTCTNACSQSNSRTCKCTSACSSSCPGGLLPSQPSGSPNMILEDFGECKNECDNKQFKDCFEPTSPQPTVNLVILPNEANYYQFSSNTHSGEPGTGSLEGKIGSLNNPVRMTASYTDIDGANDIEGLFVWFKNSTMSGKPESPIWLSSSSSNSPQAPSDDSWGFMIRRIGTSWSSHKAYVPSYVPSPSVWKDTIYTDDGFGNKYFFISSTDGKAMVKVVIEDIEVEGSNKVNLKFKLYFSGDGISANVEEVTYNIYLLGLDEFSFTPNDNYEFPSGYPNYQTKFDTFWPVNKLRYRETPTEGQLYARNWINTGKTWTIDKHKPIIEGMKFKNDEERLVFSWEVEDANNTNGNARGLYAIVGNIFTTATGDDVQEISLSTTSSGVSLRDDGNWHTPSLGDNSGDVIGVLSGVNADKSFWSTNLSGNTHSGEVIINIGENRTGTFSVYLTVFDNAGNMYIDKAYFNIGDWFVTDGGLAYSKDGTTYVTRVLEDGVTQEWERIVSGLRRLPPLKAADLLSSESLVPSKADYSSEMWADDKSELEALSKSLETASYHLINHRGHKVTSYYTTLLDAYHQRKPALSDEIHEVQTSEPGNRELENKNTASLCNSPKRYCVLSFANLVVDNLICSNNTVIFVSGNLVIRPPVKIDSLNKDACIFVVQGNVTIEEGENSSIGGVFAYDSIHAYILSDGKVIIQSETGKEEGSILDGIYINGGYHARLGTSITRSLRLQERLLFPFLAVDYHPKYGVLAKTLFGGYLTLQKTEVGFKE